jgi:hypothetical protein
MAPTRRVTLREAADILGISKEAVRKRVIRGTLRSETGEDGRRYVYLDTGGDEPPTGELGAPQALIFEMRGRIEDLREQLQAERAAHAEARRLLAAALERIPPQIEPPTEPSEAPSEATEQQGRVGAREEPLREAPQSSWESLGEGPERAEPRSSTAADAQEPQEPAERRSLWQRLFGG